MEQSTLRRALQGTLATGLELPSGYATNIAMEEEGRKPLQGISMLLLVMGHYRRPKATQGRYHPGVRVRY